MSKAQSKQPHFAAMAWATAVKRATNNWGNKKIEEAFLKPLTYDPNGNEWQAPNNFSKYLNGRMSPTKKEGKGGLNFVDRVEEAYPGTKYWLDLSLWDFLFKSDLSLSLIWKKMAECHISNKASFFELNNSGFPLRTSTINPEKLRCLATSNNVIEALTFLVGLLRESEIRVDVRSHYQAATTIKSLIPRLVEVPELDRFLGALLDYIEINYLRVTYNTPDSGADLVYPTYWRTEYPNISSLAKGEFPTRDNMKKSGEANEPISYRSLYGAPLENPLRVIDITQKCKRTLRKQVTYLAKKGIKKGNTVFELLVTNEELNQMSVIMKRTR